MNLMTFGNFLKPFFFSPGIMLLCEHLLKYKLTSFKHCVEKVENTLHLPFSF